VRWNKRDLSAKHYVYFWADGIHVQARSPTARASLSRPGASNTIRRLVSCQRFAMRYWFYNFPGRPLKTSAFDQRHRKLVRYRASPHRAPEGMFFKQDLAGHDLHARRGPLRKAGVASMVTTSCRKSLLL
jgi:hypothetical protein